MRCALPKLEKSKKNFSLTLESTPSKSFFAQKAVHSVDLDEAKILKHEMLINLENFPKTWNLGVVQGTSGSGKSSFANHFFENQLFSEPLKKDLPVIDQFSEKCSFEERAEILSRLGLSQVPCWVKPYKALSNGQRARADAAVALSKAIKEKKVVVLDEWTSVVDRTVGQIMTSCLSKFLKKNPDLKVVLVTCHNDILEWCTPDWVVDCNQQKLFLPDSDGEKKNPLSNFQFTDATETFGSVLASFTI